MCGKITLQGQLITIRDKNIQTCLQRFVKLMHYFTKFANFFKNNFKFDITIKLGLSKEERWKKLVSCLYSNRIVDFFLMEKQLRTVVLACYDYDIMSLTFRFCAPSLNFKLAGQKKINKVLR